LDLSCECCSRNTFVFRTTLIPPPITVFYLQDGLFNTGIPALQTEKVSVYSLHYRKRITHVVIVHPEKTLKALLLEQRAKIEQLKKKTDFYSTQKLIELYDRPDGAAPNPNAVPNATPARPAVAGRASLGAPGGGQQQLMGPPGVPGVNINGSQMRTPVRPNGPAQMVTPTPMHPGYMSALSRAFISFLTFDLPPTQCSQSPVFPFFGIHVFD
jgi:hypothetical protein